jgi:hypothetical protein
LLATYTDTTMVGCRLLLSVGRHAVACADVLYRPRVIMGYCDRIAAGKHTLSVMRQPTDLVFGSLCSASR